MAFRTFSATDIFYSDPRPVAGFELFMQFHEFLIIPVLCELYLGLAMTVDAPSHAERLHLADPVHGFNIAMAGFALNFTCNDVLGVVKIGMVREIVNPDPLDRFSGFNSFENLRNLFLSCVTACPYRCVAVHADIDRGNSGMLALGYR